MEASKRFLSSEVSQEGVHAVKDECDFDEAVPNQSYQKREERLESLLGAARASAEAYNTTYNTANAGSFIFHLRNVHRMGALCVLMGARAAPVPMTTTEVAIVTKGSVLGAAQGLW